MADLFTKPVYEIGYADLEGFAHTRPVEGERLDWKENLTSARVTETVTAMVNTAGGLILIGVAEQERAGERTKGMVWPPRPNHGVPASAQDAFMSMCRASYQPSDYLPRHHLVPIPHLTEKNILVVRVDQRSAPRYLWHLERGFLSRVGDQNRPSTPQVIDALLHPKHKEEQERLYKDRQILPGGKDGILQYLIAVMRYHDSASAFGTDQKAMLKDAVGRYFGRFYDLAMDSKYETVTFDLRLGLEEERMISWFSSAGVVRLTISRRWTPAVPWWWLIGESMMMLNCFQCDEISSVYPNVREGNLTLMLANWPEGRIDTEGLVPPPPIGGESLKGHAVVGEYALDPWTRPWNVVRSFVERVLADAGCLGYERQFDGLESRLDAWMAGYRAFRQNP